MDDKYDVTDIVMFSAENNPLNVKSALDDLMLSKIHNEINSKKLELAKTMFGGVPEDTDFEEEDFEDDDDTEDEDDDSLDISDEDIDELLNDLDDIELDDFEDDDETDEELGD